MPIPVYNSQIVAQSLARLTSAFITKPNVRLWLQAVMQPAQDLEDATWQVLGARFLASAQVYTLPETNSVFDTIGALVGQPRLGFGDADYKSLIYLRIAVNRSTGRTTDWSKIGAILLRTASGPLGYFDGGPNASETGEIIVGDASFELWCYTMILNPQIIATIMAAAVPNGVRGRFAFTTWPFTTGPTGDLQCGSVYDSTAGNGTLGSTYDASVGGPAAAALGMNGN